MNNQQWKLVRTRQDIESFLEKSDCLIKKNFGKEGYRYTSTDCHLVMIKNSELSEFWFDGNGNLLSECWIFPIPPFDGVRQARITRLNSNGKIVYRSDPISIDNAYRWAEYLNKNYKDYIHIVEHGAGGR